MLNGVQIAELWVRRSLYLNHFQQLELLGRKIALSSHYHLRVLVKLVKELKIVENGSLRAVLEHEKAIDVRAEPLLRVLRKLKA